MTRLNNQVPDLSGKVAVVTGGSQGIGYGCTRTLLEHNISKLFIMSQSPDGATDAIKSIREEMGDSVSTKVQWKNCNLGHWKAVLQTADEIKSTTDRIDILINNAARGIMTAQIIPYGVDEHMAINHFGHVILTSSLLPVMEETAKSGHIVRIVNLGSNEHQAAPKDTRYGRSKLGAILHARYLATHVTAEHPRILANSVHPGFVDTKASTFDIHEAYPLGGYMMSVAMKPFQKSQLGGCVSAMYAATATERSGKYICVPARIEDGSELAQSNELAEQLMRLTEKVLKDKLEAVGMKFALEFY
ncbi:retinol dehydrogenase 12 [Diaporthe sp. PMI_573]|nr:retinol dehydrogenase 12 [Diaporthaceae sp. PMI_573]